MVFVWPILFTILVLLYFTRPLLSIALLDQSFLVLNLGFFLTVVYGVYYVSLDWKAGSLAAALLCFLFWVGGSALAYHLGFSLAWRHKILVLETKCVHLFEREIRGNKGLSYRGGKIFLSHDSLSINILSS
ncbi:hypothetical protein ACS0TY_015289 [Phlomoides rotata]